MGYMTEVGILNDRWSEIRQDPKKFVDEIYEASAIGLRHKGYVTGQTTVVPSHHADDLRVLYAGGNSFFDAYPSRGMSEEQLQRHLMFLNRMKNYIKMSIEATKAELEVVKPK